MAIDSEKNACPIALRITDEVSFERSGLSKKVSPALEPGIENENTTSMAIISSSRGIISFDERSIPPCTPRMITKWHSNITTVIYTRGSHVEPEKAAK